MEHGAGGRLANLGPWFQLLAQGACLSAIASLPALRWNSHHRRGSYHLRRDQGRCEGPRSAALLDRKLAIRGQKQNAGPSDETSKSTRCMTHRQARHLAQPKLDGFIRLFCPYQHGRGNALGPAGKRAARHFKAEMNPASHTHR